MCDVLRVERIIPITTEERTNRFITEMFSLFLLCDMFANKRDILALLVRYIVDLRQCDMI